MGWSITNINNTVSITKQCARDLYLTNEGGYVWDSVKEVTQDGRLYFNPDHMEHMDFLHYEDIINVLKKHKVKGDITFGSLDGDNRGQFWGYRFDGKGGMQKLKGTITWAISQ